MLQSKRIKFSALSIQHQTPQELLAQAQLVHSPEVIADAVNRLGLEISSQLSHTAPVVICVMNGGLVFAGRLLTQLTFPLQVDYIHASRYQNQKEGQTLTWFAAPRLDLNNRTVLLIDDILDEGITLQAIREKCLALGAKAVFSAVLAEKSINRHADIRADYVGLTVPNRYVFGFGMDIHGYWRNLPAIYAL